MKRSNSRNGKTREYANKYAARDRIFKGETTIEECDDEEVCHFLLLLKRRDGLIADEEDEAQESELIKVVRKEKRQIASPAL